MKYRTLGRTGFSISEIGYGAWGIGGEQWRGGSDDESVRALHRAIDLGVNFIDTALAYGNGHSEKLVGRVVREAKNRVYIATKVPPRTRSGRPNPVWASSMCFLISTFCNARKPAFSI
jgi:aryl-alcohol dehydrogenase-like predicted oxidoreductase